jgi:hypothetical protein
MPGEDDQRGRLDESGGEEGGPVVVSVVGVKDAGTDDTQQPGKAQNLHRPEAGKFMQAEFGGFWGEGGIGWAGDLDWPASLGQSLGQCQALAIGAASS